MNHLSSMLLGGCSRAEPGHEALRRLTAMTGQATLSVRNTYP
jgi:hypothetical protein